MREDRAWLLDILEALEKIEKYLQRVFQVDDLDEVGPGQLSRQFLDCFEIENLSKADHIEDVAAAKTAPIFSGQPVAHHINHPRTITPSCR